MKPLFLTLAVLCFLHIASAQNYPPMLQDARWSENVSSVGNHVDFWITPQGDTTVGGYTYVRYMDSTTGTLIGYYREDVTTHQVYRLFAGSDQLFIDFSLPLNATMILPDGHSYYVQTIDSVVVTGGFKRKRMRMVSTVSSLSLSESWIEGVGYEYHPFLPSFERPQNPLYHINCSYTGRSPVYNFGLALGQSATPCLSLGPVSATIPQPETARFCNPVLTESRLSLSTPLQAGSLLVYDICGRPVQTLTRLQGTEIVFRRENLPAGMYCVQVLEGNTRLFSQKLLVAD